MRHFSFTSGTASGFALIAPAALAAGADSQESIGITISIIPIYAFILFVIIVVAGVYFKRVRDKRRAPLTRIFESGEAIHSVGPDASVAECVRRMTTEKIGALVIMEGDRLLGIFTERDALNKVLAAGLDPIATKISTVMTKDPFCIAPTTTVGAALELVTSRRIRHLPIVEGNRVLAVVSSGDLIHWLVEDELQEVQELVDLAAKS